jgi:integrase
VHRRLAVLRAALNAAIDAELLDQSPCRRIRVPRSSPATAYALSPEEVAQLANEVGPRYAPMIYAAAMLGLRFCECAALRVGRIDLEQGTLSVEEGLVEATSGKVFSNPPKSHSARRTMCMPSSLVAMLDRHLDAFGIDRADERALLFTSPKGGLLRYSNFRKRVWYGAVARAGLPPIGFHDLRRTAATVLVANNVSLKAAQVRLGHANPMLTLKIYAQATSDQDRAAAAAIESHFSKAIR